MAITATVAMSAASVLTPSISTATVTISNSGGGTVNVVSVDPVVTPNGQTSRAVAVGVSPPLVGGNLPTSVAGGGTLKVSFGVTPNAPVTNQGTVVAMPGSQVYSVGAIIRTTDGAITTATPATLTVADPYP